MNEPASKTVSPQGTSVAANTASTGTIPFDDAALIDRFRQGEMQAFGLLVTKYQDRIYNMILRMGPRPAEAEELAQEAFLRAMEKIDQFRGKSRFYTWLFRIAANLTISNRRRGARIKFRSLSYPDSSSGSQAECLTAGMAQQRFPGPVSSALSAEIGDRVERALGQLDEEFRDVVVLRDMEQLDYAEIAEVLELPIGTVKSRLHRARCMLKEKLADLVG